MKIALIGGALQGVEVAYLARKAGIQTVLLDRRAAVPACRLCDDFRQVDVTDAEALAEAVADVGLLFPALENQNALAHLYDHAQKRGVPIVHDPEAYAVSASKIASERFFRQTGIPIPGTWPECRFPVIVKPSAGSGSDGIQVFSTIEDLQQAIGPDPANRGWIVQSFLPGPTYSVEVLRAGKRLRALQVTDLHMDKGFDCKRVSAPSTLSSRLKNQLSDLAFSMAEALYLQGIMDVEALLHEGELNVLEIDARFPSQTPITVFWSSGVNMVEVLVKNALGEEASVLAKTSQPERGVVFEHIRVTPGRLEVTGEHAIAAAVGLQVQQDFFGTNEAITDYAEGKDHWVATLICSGSDLTDAWARRQNAIEAILRRFKIDDYTDPSPVAPAQEHAA